MQKEKFELVILESPFAGNIERNIQYGRECLRDSLKRDEAPIASHLLYTQPGVLDDLVPDERLLGIEAGLAWRKGATKHVFYIDYGMSNGMKYAEKSSTLKMEYRKIKPNHMDYLAFFTKIFKNQDHTLGQKVIRVNIVMQFLKSKYNAKKEPPILLSDDDLSQEEIPATIENALLFKRYLESIVDCKKMKGELSVVSWKGWEKWDEGFEEFEFKQICFPEDIDDEYWEKMDKMYGI